MPPSVRIDVFFPARPSAERKPRRIAEALIDGARGELRVLDRQFEGQLRKLFEQAIVVGTVPVTAGGVPGDGSPNQLPAWSPEALAHLVRFELGARNMRGEIVRLENPKRDRKARVPQKK